LAVIDLLGRTVVNQKLNLKNQKQLVVDISGLPNGIYFLQLKLQTGEVMVKKFVKE